MHLYCCVDGNLAAIRPRSTDQTLRASDLAAVPICARHRASAVFPSLHSSGGLRCVACPHITSNKPPPRCSFAVLIGDRPDVWIKPQQLLDLRHRPLRMSGQACLPPTADRHASRSSAGRSSNCALFALSCRVIDGRSSQPRTGRIHLPDLQKLSASRLTGERVTAGYSTDCTDVHLHRVEAPL